MDITLFVLGNFLDEVRTWLRYLATGMLIALGMVLSNKDNTHGR